MSLKALAHKVLERQKHVHSAVQRREQAPEQPYPRRCVICKTVLSDDAYITIWTGGDVCPSGPCLQQALEGAEDDLETPDAVRAHADRLSRERP